MRDRRALFFVIAAAACFLLVPLADQEHRWVATATGIAYAVLAVGSWLDAAGRRHLPPRRRADAGDDRARRTDGPAPPPPG